MGSPLAMPSRARTRQAIVGGYKEFQGLRLHELGDPSQPNLDMQIAQIVMFTHASELSSLGPSPRKA